MSPGFLSGYQAKPGSHLTADAVRALGEAIDALNKGPGATPEALVELARNESSSIHRYFEWDDAKAADQYRLHQARYYLRSVVVEWVTEEGKTLHLRAFNPVYGEGGVRWEGLKTAAQKDGEIQLLLERARAELRAFRKKYKALRVLDAGIELMREIDGFLNDDEDDDD
jgi:hypothetical protein